MGFSDGGSFIHSAAFPGTAAQLSIVFLKGHGWSQWQRWRKEPPSSLVPGPLVQPSKEESLLAKLRAHNVQRPGRASIALLMPGLAELRMA